jgi:hypothetical protein
MKYIFVLWTWLMGLTLSCYARPVAEKTVAEPAAFGQIEQAAQVAIRHLIRQTLHWVNHEANIELFPVLENKARGTYSGIDMFAFFGNVERLTATDFFAQEFLTKYTEVGFLIDQQLKTGEMVWPVGELPPFGTGANPWCNCQDVPYDDPDPWQLIEIEIIHLDDDRGEALWKWGTAGMEVSPETKAFRYKFVVVKEAARWKIARLEGF